MKECCATIRNLLRQDMFFRHGVRHPVRKRWWGYGLVFDRIYRINRIEGQGWRSVSAALLTIGVFSLRALRVISAANIPGISYFWGFEVRYA